VNWQDNKLSLNISRTKEFIVNFRMQMREHAPIHINGTAVERVSSFRFLHVHLTKDLTWTNNTTALVKRAQQDLYFLRQIKKFSVPPRILSKYYHCTTESILTGYLTAWYGNGSVYDCKALQRVVKMAQYITGVCFHPSRTST
jgi:hypothetical protein